MGNLCATTGADAIPTRSSPGTGSSHPTTPLCAPPGWPGSISPGHDITSKKLCLLTSLSFPTAQYGVESQLVVAPASVIELSVLLSLAPVLGAGALD